MEDLPFKPTGSAPIPLGFILTTGKLVTLLIVIFLTNIPLTKENGYSQNVCIFFAVFLQLGIVI